MVKLLNGWIEGNNMRNNMSCKRWLETTDDVTTHSSYSISSYDSKHSDGTHVSHSSFTTVMSTSNSKEHSILSSNISSLSRDCCHEVDESAVDKKKKKPMRKINLQ